MSARYKVTQSYSAFRDGTRLGPWSEGDEVTLDDDDAAFVEADAPGTLKAIKKGSSPKGPSRNREATAARNRDED